MKMMSLAHEVERHDGQKPLNHENPFKTKRAERRDCFYSLEFQIMSGMSFLHLCSFLHEMHFACQII